MGYGTYNFLKYSKGFGVSCDHILNTNIRKKRREHRSCKIEKGEGRKKDFLFRNQKYIKGIVRCSVSLIHVRKCHPTSQSIDPTTTTINITNPTMSTPNVRVEGMIFHASGNRNRRHHQGRKRYQTVWRRPAGKGRILLGHSMINTTLPIFVMAVV